MAKAKVKAKAKARAKAKPKAKPKEKELVFEIGTEEIPSVYMADALRDLQRIADQLLRQARLGFGRIRTLGTPRRLTLHVEALADKQADEVREVVGPPKSAAYDAEGKPTKAGLGFARAQGIPHRGRPYLGGGFPLRCLQRLSGRNMATLRCTWRHNRDTRGHSIPVLSY